MTIYIVLVGAAGAIIFSVLFALMLLKGNSVKIPFIGMAAFVILMAAGVVLTVMGGKGDKPDTADQPSQAVESERPRVSDHPDESGEPEGNGISDTQTEPSEEPPKPTEGTASSDSDKFEVTEYSYKGMFSRYYFLVVKNNSGENVEIGVAASFYDADGKLVGAKRSSESAVENGYSVVLFFMPDEEYESVEYELTTEKEKWYECVQSELSYEATEAKNKIILSVTNNGSEAADFVEATVLFFNNGVLVGHAQNYATDDDVELKPGKTINKEMDCYEEFDSYQVYLTGRR